MTRGMMIFWMIAVSFLLLLMVSGCATRPPARDGAEFVATCREHFPRDTPEVTKRCADQLARINTSIDRINFARQNPDYVPPAAIALQAGSDALFQSRNLAPYVRVR